MLNPRILKYQDLTEQDIDEIHQKLNPENNNLYPSIVASWSNQDGGALAIVGSDWVLGRLEPMEWDVFWTLSSRTPLNDDSLRQVIDLVKSMDQNVNVIQNIPPITLSGLTVSDGLTISDQDSFSSNYIYDTVELSNCEGSLFSDMRRLIKIFNELSPEVKQMGYEEFRAAKEDILTFHRKWHHDAATGGARMDDHEVHALEKYFTNGVFRQQDLIVLAVYLQNKMVGLTINERLGGQYALNHYFKGDSGLKGSSMFTFNATAKALAVLNISYLNYQEDMDIPGLRAFKQKLRPCKIASQLQIKFTP